MKVLRYCHIFSLVVGIILIVISALILIMLPSLARNEISKNVLMTKDSYAAQKWAKPDYDISMNFWLFNVTNVDAILLRGAKPVLDRKGPYSFVETQQKVQIDFHQSPGTIQYRNIKKYVFNVDKSCHNCRNTDTFFVPNVPFLTAINMLENMPNMDKTLSATIHFLLFTIGEHPFTSQTVESLLFQGYKDQLFQMLQNFKFLPQFQNVPDRMGFFYPKNNTDDGLYEIEQGVSSVHNLGRILKWNNKTKLDLWTTETCNDLRGTDGSLFPPFVDRSSVFWMYVSDICRSIYARYYKDVEINGLAAYRFVVPKEAFDAYNPDNAGYCKPSTQVFYPKSQQKFQNTSLFCLPSGLLNVSQCRFGAPIVLSNPNFLFSPDEVINSVQGLSPSNFDNDATFLDIEPNTGLLLNVHRRIQINVAVYKIGRMLRYANPVIIPVIMLNETAKISTAMHQYLYHNLVSTPKLISIISYIFLAIGLAVVLATALMWFIRCKNKESVVDMEHTSISVQPSTIGSTASLA